MWSGNLPLSSRARSSLVKTQSDTERDVRDIEVRMKRYIRGADISGKHVHGTGRGVHGRGWRGVRAGGFMGLLIDLKGFCGVGARDGYSVVGLRGSCGCFTIACIVV